MTEPLLSISTKVQVPYIIVKIGAYTFGLYNRTKTSVEQNGIYYDAVKVDYPKFIKSLRVQKINGTLNEYTLTLVYPITAGDDPNLIDKVLGSVSKSRDIEFTYGDCSTPSFMYKQEKGLITDVNAAFDVKGSKITYTISAVSSAMGMVATVYNFPTYKNRKPSDVIKELLASSRYGLKEIFYGMHDMRQVEQLGLILADDQPVNIERKTSITVLSYLNYLVGCMKSSNDAPGSLKKTASYVLTIHDDTKGVLDGPYFQIHKLYSTVGTSSSIDYYTIDIGYPNKDTVLDFTVEDTSSYSILYSYNQKLKANSIVHYIDDDGTVYVEDSPRLPESDGTLGVSNNDKTWWNKVTQYPIHATITIKGLLRAAILMSYIRIGIYFFGMKHNYSGVYCITKQIDTIDESGYSTVLSLLRVEADKI